MLSAATKISAKITKNLAEGDLADTVHDIAEDGRERLHEISDYATRATDKVRSAVDRTADRTRKFSHRVEDEIKTNPLRSSALALGAGVVIGALLARR